MREELIHTHTHSHTHTHTHTHITHTHTHTSHTDSLSKRWVKAVRSVVSCACVFRVVHSLFYARWCFLLQWIKKFRCFGMGYVSVSLLLLLLLLFLSVCVNICVCKYMCVCVCVWSVCVWGEHMRLCVRVVIRCLSLISVMFIFSCVHTQLCNRANVHRRIHHCNRWNVFT